MDSYSPSCMQFVQGEDTNRHRNVWLSAAVLLCLSVYIHKPQLKRRLENIIYLNKKKVICFSRPVGPCGHGEGLLPHWSRLRHLCADGFVRICSSLNHAVNVNSCLIFCTVPYDWEREPRGDFLYTYTKKATCRHKHSLTVNELEKNDLWSFHTTLCISFKVSFRLVIDAVWLISIFTHYGWMMGHMWRVKCFLTHYNYLERQFSYRFWDQVMDVQLQKLYRNTQWQIYSNTQWRLDVKEITGEEGRKKSIHERKNWKEKCK